MASPSTIRSTRSIAPSDDSSRRPTIRMTNETKAKSTMPRRTMSMPMRPSLRQHRDRAVEGEDPSGAVQERHVGAADAHVGRLRLELDVEPVGGARRHVAEVELKPGGAARLGDRRRLDGV